MDGAPLTVEPVEFVLRKNVTNEQIYTNIRANAGRVLPNLDFKRICICASGPSLADRVEDIRARQKAGWHVAAMNGSHNFLIEHGIAPDLMFMVDARPVNLPFLRLANDQTTYIIASQCHPEVFEALAGRKVMLWQMFHDEGGLKALAETMLDQSVARFMGALNVGQSCLVPIWAMGYKTWHLFGFDGSMRGDAKHAFEQPQNDGEVVQEFFWPMTPAGEAIEGVTKRYLATPTMAHGAQMFPERVSFFRRLGVEIELFGEGLIQDMVATLSSQQGAVTVDRIDDAEVAVPAPRPRRKPVERLQIVSWKWKGHIPYSAQDVNIWARQVDRWLGIPHELVCITDEPEGIDGGIRTIPLWRDQFEHGRDWHRVKIFSEEMVDLIGPRFVSMDLDTVVCGQLDPLFHTDVPFKAWQDPNRDQYCTALFQMDAGVFPHVWERFDPVAALRLRQSGRFGGYDQAWISYVLPGQPRWTREDGVLSFRNDILAGAPLESRPMSAALRPAGTRIVNFHGKYNPRDAAVQDACPWIADHYR